MKKVVVVLFTLLLLVVIGLAFLLFRESGNKLPFFSTDNSGVELQFVSDIEDYNVRVKNQRALSALLEEVGYNNKSPLAFIDTEGNITKVSPKIATFHFTEEPQKYFPIYGRSGGKKTVIYSLGEKWEQDKQRLDVYIQANTKAYGDDDTVIEKNFEIIFLRSIYILSTYPDSKYHHVDLSDFKTWSDKYMLRSKDSALYLEIKKPTSFVFNFIKEAKAASCRGGTYDCGTWWYRCDANHSIECDTGYDCENCPECYCTEMCQGEAEKNCSDAGQEETCTNERGMCVSGGWDCALSGNVCYWYDPQPTNPPTTPPTAPPGQVECYRCNPWCERYFTSNCTTDCDNCDSTPPPSTNIIGWHDTPAAGQCASVGWSIREGAPGEVITVRVRDYNSGQELGTTQANIYRPDLAGYCPDQLIGAGKCSFVLDLTGNPNITPGIQYRIYAQAYDSVLGTWETLPDSGTSPRYLTCISTCTPYTDGYMKVFLLRNEEGSIIEYSNDIPFRDDGLLDYPAATGWANTDLLGLPAGSTGEVYAFHTMEWSNGTYVRINLIRGSQAWFKDVPYVDNQPDFGQGTWILAGGTSGFPGSGEIEAMESYNWANNDWARVTIVRGGEVWYRDMPFLTSGAPDASRATAWTKSGTVAADYPGSGDLFSEYSFNAPGRNAIRTIIARGTETWFKDIPFDGSGAPDLVNASCWTKAGEVIDLPGSERILEMAGFIYPTTNYCAADNYKITACATAPTPTPSTGAWWQAVGGDLITADDILSLVPAGLKLIKDSLSGFAGVAFFNGTISPTPPGVSSTNWNVNSPYSTDPSQYNYTYFRKLIPSTSTVTSIGSGTIAVANYFTNNGVADSNGYKWFEREGDLTISTAQNLTSADKIVLFVKGDLNINALLKFSPFASPKGFLMVIVDGNITVSSSLSTLGPELEGLYFAGAMFRTSSATPALDTQIEIRGSVATLGGVDIRRDLGAASNATLPAETFTFAPDLVMQIPPSLKTKITTWREVAP